MHKPFYLFASLLLLGLILSGIRPHDYFTWMLEVIPAILALILLSLSYKRFPLSNLLYALILLHACVLFIGGHYTYAEVPLFNTIRDMFHQQRNNYDKVGHFIQGFVPAMVCRELLIRKDVLKKKGWMFFISVSICLAISAFYELLEAFVALTTGDSAEAFLGTQGYVWDTQSDMCYALSGAMLALILLASLHNRSIRLLEQKNL